MYTSSPSETQNLTPAAQRHSPGTGSGDDGIASQAGSLGVIFGVPKRSEFKALAGSLGARPEVFKCFWEHLGLQRGLAGPIELGGWCG